MIFQQLFEEGISFDVFTLNDKDSNIQRLLDLYNQIELDDELIKKIKEVHKEIYIIAFAEIWCPDCIINLPALKKISDINPGISFKILPREDNEKHMENYKIGGKPKIPTFIVFNENFEELGAFIETPKVLKDIVNRGNQVEVIVAKRKYQKGDYVKDTLQEIMSIIK